jgi:chromosome segregation ATPase
MSQEVIQKLHEMETLLRDHKNDAQELRNVINELMNIVQSLDKDMAIQTEKQSHLFYRIEQLQKELDALENRGEKGSDRQRDLVEKALMAVLGGLITYIFSLAK